MKEIKVKIVHAFSINGMGGNPAGVVINADDLSRQEKQKIAAKLGLSEIAYVSKSNEADFKLEFFTPTKQIAHCGHATIATFTYLKQQGFILNDFSSKETIDGNREIFFKNGFAYMEQQAPIYKDVQHELIEILSSIGVSESDLFAKPSIVNTGNSFLIIPIANANILKELQPNFDMVKQSSEKNGLIGYYLFSLSDEPTVVATARMFAPLYGINEEAATGMAAGPLACYLFGKGFTKKMSLQIKQGELMKPLSPSLIYVDLIIEDGKIKKLFAGGDAVVVDEKTVII